MLFGRELRPLVTQVIAHRVGCHFADRGQSLLVALALANRGHFSEAYAVAQDLVDQAPASAAGYLLRGQLLFSGRRDDDLSSAAAEFRRAVFLDPNNVASRYWYASALAKLGRTKKALIQLDACAAIGQDERATDSASDAADLQLAVEHLRAELK